jgi:hypothetical protein
MQARKHKNHWSIIWLIQKIVSYMGAAGLLCLLTTTPVLAASVSYFLDQSNRLPDGTNYLKVTIDDEGAAGAINFHIQALEPLSALACDMSGILRFGFNGDELDKNNIIGLPDGWKIKNDKKIDGFGKFENVLIGKKWDGQEPLSFSIVGIDGDGIFSYAESHDMGDGVFFSAFVNGIELHRHHGHGKWYGDDCHRCTKGSYFGGGELAPVPVPGALWLFGSGLAGMFGLASRRRAKKT